MKIRALLSVSLLAAACASAPRPTGPPEELGPLVVAELEAGRPDAARELLEPALADEAYAERLYPVLYEAAREQYEAGDPALAADVLALVVEGYPEADAAREALASALFLERAGRSQADPESVQELAGAIDDARRHLADPPAWLELAAAQNAIDRGRLAEARQSLELFRQTWDGEPAALALYVEDVERWLDSH